MLDVLRSKSPPESLGLALGTMESFDLGAPRFRLITAPFRALSHLLDIDAQLSCLACVRHHLAPGGTFAFDVFDPKHARTALLEEPESLAVTFHERGHEIRRFESIRRDLTRQVLTVTMRFEGGPPELTGSSDIHMRWFYRYELEHLLVRAGFDDLRFYASFDRQPWRAGGETIVVARSQ